MICRAAIKTAAAACALAWAVNGAWALDRFGFATPGAGKDLREALLAASLLDAAIRRDKRTDPQELIAAAQADYARLTAALYDAGHFSGIVQIRIDGREAAAIPPLDPPARVGTIAVTVRPGPPFRFGRATVAPLARGTALPDSFRPGAQAGTEPIRAAALAAVDGWRAVGYAKAEPSGQSITADHAARRLDASVTIAPGRRLRFGQLAVTGESRVRAARIREIAGFPAGTVFDPEEIAAAAKRLRRTGVFRSVALSEADTANPDSTLDITAALVDEKPRRIGFSAEYTTGEGFQLGGFWLHRNIFGGAERLRVDGEISGIAGQTAGLDYSLETRLTRPATFGPDTSLFVEGELEKLNEPNYISERAQLGAGLAHIFTPNLEGEAGAALRFSRITDSAGQREFLHLAFPASLTWDRRDDRLNPGGGFFLSGEVMPFIGLNGSETGGRLELDARTYYSLTAGGGLVVAARAQLGSVVGASLAGTPHDLLFYSGGGGTVRGHSYQSLGVPLAGGATSGGRSFAGLSLELRGKINDSFGLVGFVDYGMISAGSVPGGSGNSHAGAGLGLRYNTGFGPLRLDVATPVSGTVTGSRVQIYIGLGQAF